MLGKGAVLGRRGQQGEGREDLPGLRDTSPEVPCSTEGPFDSSGGSQQEVAVPAGLWWILEVLPSTKRGCPSCSPIFPGWFHTAGCATAPSRTMSWDHHAMPYGSTAGIESWGGGREARGRATHSILASAPGPRLPAGPQVVGKGEQSTESSFTPSTGVCAPAASPPTSHSIPSFPLGFQPLWGAEGAAAGAWQHWGPSCREGTPESCDPVAGLAGR